MAQFESERIWVAYSGGLDSTVLLHSLVQLKPSQSIVAVHINHQLSPHADVWQRHCAELCADWGVALHTKSVTVTEAGRGLEDAAREARYKVLSNCLAEGGVMFTGHHADDQMETVLLRLQRGSGPRGLAAMAYKRPLGSGLLVRPLLAVTRLALEGYARGHQLKWIEDESNLELRFDRNYVRHQVLPTLQHRWPDIHRRWQQSVELCAESEALLEDLAALDLDAAQQRSEWGGASLDLGVLQSLSRPRRHNLLRHWLRVLRWPLPSAQQLQEVDAQLIDGREDARARVCWQQVMACRFRNRFYMLRDNPSIEHPATETVAIPYPSSAPLTDIPLPAGGRLRMRYSANGQTNGRLRSGLPDLHLRWRQGGERCQPSGREHSQTLKRLLQEADLEPWWRAHLPLIYSGEQLVAAGDLWICRGYVAAPNEPGYQLEWSPTGAEPPADEASFD